MTIFLEIFLLDNRSGGFVHSPRFYCSKHYEYSKRIFYAIHIADKTQKRRNHGLSCKVQEFDILSFWCEQAVTLLWLENHCYVCFWNLISQIFIWKTKILSATAISQKKIILMYTKYCTYLQVIATFLCQMDRSWLSSYTRQAPKKPVPNQKSKHL